MRCIVVKMGSGEYQVTLSRAPWTLTKNECQDMKDVITMFQTPTGYMRYLREAFSKLRRRGVDQLVGLKTHDWHKMIQVNNVANSIIVAFQYIIMSLCYLIVLHARAVHFAD
jgi:hypothetical protein